MKFRLNEKARRISEKSVGMKCSEIKNKRLGMFEVPHHSSKKNIALVPQIKPRGSVYLQLGRKVSMKKIEKIVTSL